MPPRPPQKKKNIVDRAPPAKICVRGKNGLYANATRKDEAVETRLGAFFILVYLWH